MTIKRRENLLFEKFEGVKKTAFKSQIEFYESLKQQRERGLTEKQLDTLEKIIKQNQRFQSEYNDWGVLGEI